MGLWDVFENAEKEREEIKKEFEKLQADPCLKTPQKYDRVLFACGLLGMGFHWVRKEAIVVECGETSYKLLYPRNPLLLKDEPFATEWVHQALITDVLGQIDREVIEKYEQVMKERA